MDDHSTFSGSFLESLDFLQPIPPGTSEAPLGLGHDSFQFNINHAADFDDSFYHPVPPYQLLPTAGLQGFENAYYDQADPNLAAVQSLTPDYDRRGLFSGLTSMPSASSSNTDLDNESSPPPDVSLARPPSPVSEQSADPPLQAALSHTALRDDNANESSWKDRNPGRPVLSIRPGRGRLTDAQKSSQGIARDQRADRTKALNDAIHKVVKDMEARVEEIATMFDRHPKEVEELIGIHTRTKSTRKVSLKNALIHAKAEEVNAGSRRNLAELTELVANDPDMKNLTKAEKKSYLEKLEEHREKKFTGLRANNAAAARDVLATVEATIKLLDNLASRTGAYACFFLTRGHVNDTAQATYYGTHNSMDFWEDVLKMDPDTIVRQYEQWACALSQNIIERDNLANVRRQCTRMILTALKSATHVRSILMCYRNYEKDIVEKYSVRIIGWPKDVKFVSPSAIGAVGDIRKLRDAWKSGACHWEKMTKGQLASHLADLEERRDRGETVEKPPRKQRSDKGTKRKSTSASALGPEDTEAEPQGSAKRARKTNGGTARASKGKGRVQKAPKSAAIVDSDSSSDESSGPH
ncbi:hypothetical protein PLICRDRAFT_27424 [Plicaturopsis crispa FD-325 SS-3]|nr:hypothetical protein PLICRDRAFT_27424 [Plicaturopsis crispa FD-325 SS-3]